MSHLPVDPPDGSGPDQPDRRWRAAASRVDPADPLLLQRLGIVVPDDARALDADRAALFGELPGSRLHRVVRRVLPGPGLVTPMATIVLMCVLVTGIAVASSLVGLLGPRVDTSRQSAVVPLASAPVATPGTVGGLLPDAGVQVDTTLGMSARELRPAVLFHPPTGESPATCDTCADQLETWWRQAGEYGLAVYVVVPPDRLAEATQLAGAATLGAAHVVSDGSGALTSAYAAEGASRVVLVHTDGIVGRVLDDPAPAGRFEPLLSPLRTAGAPPVVRSADAGGGAASPGLRPSGTAD